jgi:hypothetical protein
MTPWNVRWLQYTGPVRVILDRPGCPVAYGEATGEVLDDSWQRPGMAVLLTTGAELWTHPQNVCPVEVTA